MRKRSVEAVVGMALWGALFVLLNSISPRSLWAAEVVDLRIGVHPEYTRVVFELDRPAGYKLERGVGPYELVVTLEADSIARKVKSPKSLIDSIKISPTATGSQARVALVRDGLSLKEMILASPPRIVLDVIAPKGSTAKAAAAKTPSPAKEVRVAATPPASTAKDLSSAKKAVSPKPQAKAVPPKPAKRIAANSKPAKPIIKLETPPGKRPSSVPVAKQKPASPMPRVAQGSQGTPPKALNPAAAPPAPKAVASQPPSWPAPIEADDSAASAKQIFALGGLAAVVVAFVMVRRRRARVAIPVKSPLETAGQSPEPVDANPFAAVEPAEEDAPDRLETEGDLSLNPGPDFDAETRSAIPDEAADSEAALFARMTEEQMSQAPDLEDPSPFASPSSDSAPMDFGEVESSASFQPASEPGLSSLASPQIDPYEAGREGGREALEEAMALVHGLEDKLAGLQERLAEAVDSRERIERQMAAQNEELRVQRAAIARTQRAVRNISRPDEPDRQDSRSPAAD